MRQIFSTLYMVGLAGSASPVTSHDMFVAKLAREPNKHIDLVHVDLLIEDYNSLLRNSQSLPKIKDPYILTFYLVLCEQSLIAPDGTHPALDVPCKPIGPDDGERTRAVHKLRQTIMDVNEDARWPLWKHRLNDFVQEIESGARNIALPSRGWGDQRPSILAVWNRLVNEDVLEFPTPNSYHQQAICVLNSSGVLNTIADNIELCLHLFKGVLEERMSSKILGPIRPVFFSNLCKGDLDARVTDSYSHFDTSGMTDDPSSSDSPRSLRSAIMKAFNSISLGRPVEGKLALIAEAINTVRANPPSEPLDYRYAVDHLKLCYRLTSIPGLCEDMPTRLKGGPEGWKASLESFIAQMRMGELRVSEPIVGRTAHATRTFIRTTWNAFISGTRVQINDRAFQIALQLFYAGNRDAYINDERELCRILRRAHTDNPEIIGTEADVFVRGLCSGVPE